MLMREKTLLYRYIIQYKWAYFIGIAGLLAVDYALLYIPRLTGEIADGIKDGTMDMSDVTYHVIWIMIVTILIFLGRIIWRYFIMGSSRKIETGIRRDLFIKWESLDARYFNEQKTGDLMAYASNDLNAVRMMVGPGIVIVFDAVVMTIFVVIQMAVYVNLPLTLMAVSPMPIIALGGIYFGKKIEKLFGDKQVAFANLSDHVQESFTGIRVIKSFIQESYQIQNFNKLNQDNYDKNMKLAKLASILMPLMTLIVGISLLIGLGYGGHLTMINQISLGQFIAFNQYILMLVWPMMAISMGINVFAQGKASKERLQTVLQEEADVKDEVGVRVKEKGQGEITIKNLSFEFPDGGYEALKNVSIHIRPGETLAILGRTGSGKSTLVNLLLRLYNPPRGTIFFDQDDLMDITLESARAQIAYVPQDNFLFSDTIANNIAFGFEKMNMDLVEKVAKDANVHQNIIDFPMQYDTIVGERGATLSGGQKQRVAIARALGLEAPILILDDSLSAVDTNTEEEILKRLAQRKRGQTTIIIAHRISTIQNADQIIVLDHGQIVERGLHEELLKKRGIYYHMHRQQKLEKELEEA